MARAAGDELTDKQAAFVREYLVDMNAAAAARRAGYSKTCAAEMGHENLRKPHIMGPIQEALEARAERTEITADRVLEELARIAFADLRKLFTWDEERACYVPSRELTDAEAAAISSVKANTTRQSREDGETETKIRLELKTYDKLGALKELAKHLGLSPDRLELSGPDGRPIEHEHRLEASSDQELLERATQLTNRLKAASGNGARP